MSRRPESETSGGDDDVAPAKTSPRLLGGLIRERELGFFVEDQRADELVGVAGAGDIDADGQDAGYAALEVQYVGRGVLLRLLVFFHVAVDAAGLFVAGAGIH